MRFLVLATDYDGTLASDGKVDHKTVEALDRLRATGRKLILVTGRHLPELHDVFPQLDRFDRVVAENGGLLYVPATREEKVLTEPPDPHFLSLLRERNVPLAVGRAVVATWQPFEKEVLGAIRDSGLELQVILNKSAVMVLPSSVNKGTGLKAALKELGISPHNVVSVGDAENDHAFLRISECAVAVANALPTLKEHADVVLDKPRGDGVTDLIDRLVADDLAQFEPELQRHWIGLGNRLDDTSRPVAISPRAGSILVAGSAVSGKSPAVSGLLEQLVQQGYQFCLLDPEGDYEGAADVLTFGTAQEPPDPKAILRALHAPQQSVLVNLLGIPPDDRPGYFSSLLPRLEELRASLGHPHWLVIDDAHRLLPAAWSPSSTMGSDLLASTILITVHPEHVAKTALDKVNVLVAIGKSPMDVFRSFSKLMDANPPAGDNRELPAGEALVWLRQSGEPPVRVNTSNHYPTVGRVIPSFRIR